MDWTEIIITVNAKDIDKAAAIAQVLVPGVYIEDYRTLEQEAFEIAGIDLIDEDLLAKDRTKGLIHIYISPEDNPAEATAFLTERLTAEKIAYDMTTNICRNEDWENNWKAYFKPMEIGKRLLIRPSGLMITMQTAELFFQSNRGLPSVRVRTKQPAFALKRLNPISPPKPICLMSAAAAVF